MKNRIRNLTGSKKIISGLALLVLVSVALQVSAVDWWLSSSFCMDGAPGSPTQHSSCDNPNELSVGAVYGIFSNLKKGNTHNFVFTNGTEPIGTLMKRICFTSNVFCDTDDAFDTNPNGNYFVCTDPDNCGGSPIIFDIRGDGIDLGELGATAKFDIDANGTKDVIQWVRQGGNEPFLALDLNGNGIIDDGSELFGTATALILQEGKKATHGFRALS